jgi:hypothetical protein
MSQKGRFFTGLRRVLYLSALLTLLAICVAPQTALAAGPASTVLDRTVQCPPARPPALEWAEIEELLANIARGAAGVGILLFAVSLVLPGDALSIFGLQIPQNYLMRIAMAALLVSGASVIVTTLFGA